MRNLVFLSLAACASPNESSTEQGVFTTGSDGARVDENVYDSKDDVYLDGGPKKNGSVGLEAGDYAFKVTDPSGKTLLSSDALECRQFHLTDDGQIDKVLGSCAHKTGVDVNGGITVQLMPFADTPNHGGEYKVHVSLISNLKDGEFVHRFTKTDNFKIKTAHEGGGDDCDADSDEGGGTCPPEAVCGDGHVDAGEECDDGNAIDSDGCDSNCKICPPAPVCGDGHVDAGEECDDGNAIDSDGCDSNCKICPITPVCGDGHVDPGEECDDGNTNNHDSCDNNCKLCP